VCAPSTVRPSTAIDGERIPAIGKVLIRTDIDFGLDRFRMLAAGLSEPIQSCTETATETARAVS
jgi:hypothetical protein